MTITAGLSNAYFSSKYVVHYGQKEIKLQALGTSEELRKLLQKHNAHSCAFITAYNPDGIDTDIETNETNQKMLLSEVTRNWEYYSGYGVDQKERRKPEPSLLILGINLEEARKLSHRYHQNAFLFGSVTGRTELIATNPDDQSDLIHPLARASQELNKAFRDSGFTVKENSQFLTNGFEVTFVPAKRGTSPTTTSNDDE